MQPQLSQDYGVDARYTAGKGSVDNAAGKQFVRSYIQKRRNEATINQSEEADQEGRFFMAGPGAAQYTFRNGFRASK
jgi:hypothetical protein